jgi:hypothetical protein
VHLGDVGELAENGLVAQGHVEETVVGESAHGGNGGALLATAETSGGDEETGVFALEREREKVSSMLRMGTRGALFSEGKWEQGTNPEATSRPLLAGGVPKSLPLGREVSVTGRDAEEEGIVLLELGRVGEGLDVGVLGRGVHLGQDLLRKSLRSTVSHMISHEDETSCRS